MELDLSLALRLGSVATSSPKPEGNGLAITNAANTTVTAAAGGRTGYTITKSGGVGGAWDAAATSATVADNALLRIRFGSGQYMAGISPNPAADNSFGNLVGFAVLSGVLYVYSLGAQVGAGRGAPPAYGFVVFDDATNEVRVYTGTTDVFGAATLIETVSAMDFAAAGFDCSLNDVAANFEARFTAA
jgi:hypothetical protein